MSTTGTNELPRCNRCGWPLVADNTLGCTAGNCIQIRHVAVPAADTSQTANLLLAQLGRAMVEQIRAGEAARDPVAFAARWEQIVRELEGAL